MLITFLFLIAAVITALASLSTLAFAPRTAGWVGNLQGAARVGVFAGASGAVARVLTDGQPVGMERMVLMVSLAVLYLVQARSEAQRQAQRRPGAAPR